MTTSSKIIKFLRAPLIIGVLIVHSAILANNTHSFTLYESTHQFLVFIRHFCVPLFFIFSGYLFFNNINFFSFKIYKKKILTRVKTLLIPYFFWNLIVVVCYMISYQLFGRFEDLTKYSLIEWFDVFYSKFGGFPIAYPLWYLRDLMLLCILSPIIYFFVKYTKHILILLLYILIIFNLNLPNLSSILFFSIGALFSIHKIDFNKLSLKVYPIAIIISIVGIIFYFCQFDFESINPKILFTTSFIIICIVFTNKIIINEKVYNCINHYSKYSFIVYVYHAFPAIVLNAIYFEICNKFINNALLLEYAYIAAFFINPIILFMGGILLNFLLTKHCNTLKNIILGQR